MYVHSAYYLWMLLKTQLKICQIAVAVVHCIYIKLRIVFSGVVSSRVRHVMACLLAKVANTATLYLMFVSVRASATLCYLTLTCSINPLTIGKHSGPFHCIISSNCFWHGSTFLYHSLNFKITLCLGVNVWLILLAVHALADMHCLLYQTCILKNLCQLVHANYQLIATLALLIIADSLFQSVPACLLRMAVYSGGYQLGKSSLSAVADKLLVST